MPSQIHNLMVYTNFAKNVLLSNIKRLSFPYKLTFAVTYLCNSRCQICRIWKRKKEKELTKEKIKDFFETNNKFNWIDLTGGEIFLKEDLVQITESIVKNCENLYLLHFPTNGFLTEKILADTKKILELSPHRMIVTVSLDGPEELHDELRGVRGGWKKTIETFQQLKKLKKKNFEVYFGMTLSKYNSGKIDNTIKEVKLLIPDISYNDFHLNIAQTSAHFYKNVGMNLGIDDQIIGSVKKFRGKRKKKFSGVHFLEDRYLKLISEYIKKDKVPLACQSLSASVFIDPQGNVYPCAIWDKKIANLENYDFDLKKIWDLNKVKKIRKKIIHGSCPGCWTPCEAYQTILGNLM